MDKLAGYLAKRGLSPEGAALLIHKKGPPRVKKPGKYATDVCFPVNKKAWVMPKSYWKGEFILDQIVGDEVLTAFGLGDLDKTTNELVRLLIAEAKKMGRKQAGAPIQVLYMRPGDGPPQLRASAIHLPLN